MTPGVYLKDKADVLNELVRILNALNIIDLNVSDQQVWRFDPSKTFKFEYLNIIFDLKDYM